MDMNSVSAALVALALFAVVGCAAPGDDEEAESSSEAIKEGPFAPYTGPPKRQPRPDACSASYVAHPTLGELEPGENRNVVLQMINEKAGASSALTVVDTYRVGHPRIRLSASAHLDLSYWCVDSETGIRRLPAAISCREGEVLSANSCTSSTGVVEMSVDCPGMGYGNDFGVASFHVTPFAANACSVSLYATVL
jgi:hypothetical protein